jgi:RNA polymerase sigma factor (sigma-70 family)
LTASSDKNFAAPPKIARNGEAHMSGESSTILQALLDRMNQGDLEARRELLDRACNRLARLVAAMLSGSFPALRDHHELDSVVHESWLRLVQALDKTEPPTVADFFRLAAHKIRQVLLDMADRRRRQAGREVLHLDSDVAQDHGSVIGTSTLDPARLALWSEFHTRVADLPEQERSVFELHYYVELPQVEIARLLDLHPRKVSYLWIAATDKLADRLDGLNEVL